MSKKVIKVVSFDASEVLNPAIFHTLKNDKCHVAEVAEVAEKKQANGKMLQNEVAEVAEPENTTLNKVSLFEVAEVAELKTLGKMLQNEVAEVAEPEPLPPLPRPLYKIPVSPIPHVRACFSLTLLSDPIKREREGIHPLYRNTWQTWQRWHSAKIATAWNFIKTETGKYPSWAKRTCRREALETVFFHVLETANRHNGTEPDLDTVLERLRAKYAKEWKNKKWLILPPRLRQRTGESHADWDARCWKAGGFFKWA